MTDGGSDRRIEVYTRSFSAASEQQRRTIERVAALESAGSIAGYTSRTWPGRVRYDRPARAIDVYRRARRWASRYGFDLAPGFERRTYESSVTDDAFAYVTTPAVCLLVYEADRLVSVLPCTDGDAVYTPDDYLSALESGTDFVDSVMPNDGIPIQSSDPDPGRRLRSRTAGPPRLCRACGSALAHVHGVFSCVTCGQLFEDDPEPPTGGPRVDVTEG